MATWSRIVVVATLIGILAGCGNGKATEDKSKAQAKRVEQKPTAIPVEAQLPIRGELSEFFETTTRVEAERSVQVTSQGMGRCTALHAEEGDEVSNGDVLAELDTSELNTQLASARTQLAKAKVDLDRSKRAFDEGIGAKVEYDNAKFAVEQQQSSLEQLEVQLGNMTVRAPLTGIVTKKLAQTGALISSGTPIFEIIDPATYVLNINAPEKGYLSRIKVGQKASVELDSLDEPVNAKVRRINPAVDPASGTVKVTLDFEKAALPKLRNNAFSRVNLILATHENALMIPKNAIVEENTRKYVYVVERPANDAEAAAPSASDPGKVFLASRKEIQTGLEDSTNIEILEGLADENLIVTVGQQTLKSGAEVKLTSIQEELLAKSGLSADEALKAAKVEHDQSVAASK